MHARGPPLGKVREANVHMHHTVSRYVRWYIPYYMTYYPIQDMIWYQKDIKEKNMILIWCILSNIRYNINTNIISIYAWWPRNILHCVCVPNATLLSQFSSISPSPTKPQKNRWNISKVEWTHLVVVFHRVCGICVQNFRGELLKTVWVFAVEYDLGPMFEPACIVRSRYPRRKFSLLFSLKESPHGARRPKVPDPRIFSPKSI